MHVAVRTVLLCPGMARLPCPAVLSRPVFRPLCDRPLVCACLFAATVLALSARKDVCSPPPLCLHQDGARVAGVASARRLTAGGSDHCCCIRFLLLLLFFCHGCLGGCGGLHVTQTVLRFELQLAFSGVVLWEQWSHNSTGRIRYDMIRL